MNTARPPSDFSSFLSTTRRFSPRRIYPPSPGSANPTITSAASRTKVTQSSHSRTSNTTVTTTTTSLLTLLQQRKTEEAWLAYTGSDQLPNSTCLSRLVSQLSYQKTHDGLTRAQSIVRRLYHDNRLHLLDCNSLGLLAVAAAKSGQVLYATSIIKSMLKSGYLPHVKAWSAVISRLSSSGDDGPTEALTLFDLITKRVQRISDPNLIKDSRPDTASYNAVLNACANIGDTGKFLQLFEGMSEFGCEPDVLTYNVMMKLCARADRKELLVFVLERIIEKKIPLCMTTLQSLVAAYVGFGDLESAEKIVQALREGRRDLCKILRDSTLKEIGPRQTEPVLNESDVFKELLPNCLNSRDKEPPELPHVFEPNSRMYTTLMKGYMKVGRVTDTVRMLQAMKHQEDMESQPDHVTYTTVISTFVEQGSMDQAREVLNEMFRFRVPANSITYNILIKGYCQKLQIDRAEELMKEMVNGEGIEPDVVSYNTLIDGCILVDDSARALLYFNEMRARGITPNKISYTTLMKAFALSGQPKLANKVFDEMVKDPGIKVDLVAWNMLVEGYCKLGKVEEAKTIIQKMKETGTFPNVATYGSLANGIQLARKPGEALLLWSEIKERCGVDTGTIKPDTSSAALPPLKPDEGLLVTLADICVRAAFFRKALEIIACMEENGISPNKTKYKRIYVEMHSRMFTSKHASRARQERRKDKKRAAEAFKFWLGLPNSYYGSEWRLDSASEQEYSDPDFIDT